jgi:hypothetical protein
MTGSAHWWLYYRSVSESDARDAFALRFGREPERCERDDGEGCWWLGPVTEKELRRWKKRRKRQAELAL